MVEAVLQSKGSMRSKILAMMSYLGILVFVPLIMNRDDQYVYFHARQGLVIWIMGILAIFTLYLPGIGKFFFSSMATLVLLFSLAGIVSVLFYKAWRLPLIYTLSTRF
ncbi:MAG: hypothetical protein HON68_09790 [Gammaproteobacteria bacterium]|jgi:uncharacterized membrane protein|nr:hypothetical protein [Gammaproteobacteria bacterium]MBT3488892.1 hypothetical protein [Gammaproteobacteria bacterium]MBT3718555.1 hypothetical protein [Gammaproteobacteria bacterium]MBT3844476.1 hypothetical protein [Gammaproteobacteria bacterium]MBT3891930.1 hypothetical protein [Gammaproteobacteria bacterium]